MTQRTQFAMRYADLSREYCNEPNFDAFIGAANLYHPETVDVLDETLTARENYQAAADALNHYQENDEFLHDFTDLSLDEEMVSLVQVVQLAHIHACNLYKRADKKLRYAERQHWMWS